MKSETYIENVKKTLSSDIPAIKSRLEKEEMIHMLHAAMGLVTESAELLDMLKKHIFYGKDLDLVNMEEELGDLDWYQSVAIHASRLSGHYTDWEQIWEKNIAKLQKRYGDKFTSDAAINRDLNAERKILESK